MSSNVPDNVAAFIMRHIDSVAQLEALLLLRENRSIAWSSHQLAQRLYISEPEAALVLAQLMGSGLVIEENGSFRYVVGAQDVASTVDQLAAAYSRQLIPITNLIHAKPRRIRQFADAFKFRKDQ